MIKYLANALIGGDGQIEKRNMSWNMIGSFLYALASMVLTIAVIQIVGEDEGGIFSFAYSTFGQHMFMVAYFGIRPFQITDTRRRFTFGEYLRLRLMTCGAALVFIILGGAFNAYVNLFYYALIIMQEQKRIFLGYVGVTAAALLISSPCVRAAGLLGGSLSYLLLMAALTACFGLTSLVMYRRRARGI